MMMMIVKPTIAATVVLRKRGTSPSINPRIKPPAIAPGMLPRPGYGFGFEGRIFRHEGQVTVPTTTRAKSESGVRTALQKPAKAAGLTAPKDSDYELHETPLFGNSSQTDVQKLHKDYHYDRHNVHRRTADGGFEGGTTQVRRRNLRQANQ